MGQIIKIYDYISRYEQNIYNYAARFISLKRKRWELLKNNWENGYFFSIQQENDDEFFAGYEQEAGKSPLRRLKDLIRRKNKDDEPESPGRYLHQEKEELPESITELKSYFLDEIFQVQLSWASSTLQQKSYIDASFLREWQLKFFAQRFPDTYLFLYKPVLEIKRTRVEAETILITPAEVLCLRFLEDEEDSVYIGSEDRFWELRAYQRRKKIINPTLTLNRTEKIVKSILRVYEIDFPITKVLIAKDGFIDYPSAPYGLEIIDKRNFAEWFQKMRSYRSPLKHDQLKVADALLSFCRTQAALRTNGQR